VAAVVVVEIGEEIEEIEAVVVVAAAAVPAEVVPTDRPPTSMSTTSKHFHLFLEKFPRAHLPTVRSPSLFNRDSSFDSRFGQQNASRAFHSRPLRIFYCLSLLHLSRPLAFLSDTADPKSNNEFHDDQRIIILGTI
jgi:hypothetical protein